MPKPSAKSAKSGPQEKVKNSILVLRVLSVVLLSAAIVLVMGMFIEWQWLELYVSYLPQLLLVGAALHLVAATLITRIVLIYSISDAAKKTGLVFISFYALSVIVVALGATFSVGRQIPTEFALPTDSSQVLRAGTFNKLYNSQDFGGDMQFVRAANLDMLALQEASEKDVDFAMRLLGYEHSFTTDCDCSAGDTEVGIVSRYPITYADTLYESTNSTIVRSLIRIDGEHEIAFYAVHMFVPYQAEAYAERAQAYQLLIDSVQAETVPVIVAGDFNTTVFSPQLRNFNSQTDGLIANVTERFWPRCSWYGVSSAGCLRLDYVFVPEDSDVYSMSVLEAEGSDHRPVAVEFSLSRLVQL